MKARFSYALMALAIGSRVEVTPVQKVVELMETMLEKGKAEKQAELLQFAAHRRFCKARSLEKHGAISEAQVTIASLKADMQKYTADVSVLTDEIALLGQDISTWSGEIRAATNVREIEKADHDATKQSYSETIGALQRAAAVLEEAAHDREQLKEASLAHAVAKNLDEIKIGHESSHKVEAETGDAIPRAVAVLKKAEHDRKQKGPLEAIRVLKKAENARKQREASWAQLMKKLIPDAARKAIDVFLQQGEMQARDLGSVWYRLIQQGQHDCEFQPDGVIELLGKLTDRFVDERTTLEKEEMNSEHNYAMLMQDLKAQIAQASSDRVQKTESKAKKLQAHADAADELKDTTATMQADQTYISDLTTTCEQTASAFEARQHLRSDEIVAIEKAINIISGDAVAGNADKHLSTSSRRDLSFAQLRSHSAIFAEDRVVKYLQAQAKKLNSRVLASMAQHVAHDPSVKVKKMMKDLIVRLVEEANEEAEHKDWCDAELSTNEHTRKAKTDQVETLHAEVDELQASISKLTERIGDFTEAVSAIDAAMAEAKSLRVPDKAKNAEAIKDAQEAQSAVSQALSILREFYSKAAKSVVLVQQPKMFGSSYKGLQSETRGVVGMLEQIKSDFARLESETEAAEVAAEKDYNEFMADSKADKEQKSADIAHSVAKKQDDLHALAQKNQDLDSAQKDLDAALAYFEKLKPSCTESGVTYEDRVGCRKAEIESLQEALRILNGADLGKAS